MYLFEIQIGLRDVLEGVRVTQHGIGAVASENEALPRPLPRFVKKGVQTSYVLSFNNRN